MTTQKNRFLYVAALGLFLAGVGYLVFSGLSENSVYFLNVSEALAMPPEKLGSARLFGTVKGEGIEKLDQGPGVTFQLEDNENSGKTLWIVYTGAVPDTFKAGAEVIVEGKYEASGNRFHAKTLMTKCPSKYQKENRG